MRTDSSIPIGRLFSPLAPEHATELVSRIHEESGSGQLLALVALIGSIAYEANDERRHDSAYHAFLQAFSLSRESEEALSLFIKKAAQSFSEKGGAQ